MDELLDKLLRGVDLTDPEAPILLFRNLMELVPWWPLFWFTLFCVAVGLAIAFRRGSSPWMAVFWALLLGPFSWLLSWYQVPSSRRRR